VAPQHRPLEERLVAGRRATTRRRASVAIGTLTGALVVGGIVCSVLPGAGPSDDGSVVASQPTMQPPVPSVSEPTTAPWGTAPITFDLDGTLIVADGVTIERQVDLPASDDGTITTAAVVDHDGSKSWAMARLLPNEAAWTEEADPVPSRSFEQWVRDVSLLSTAPKFGGPPRGWVDIDAQGTLTAHRGATLVAQGESGTGGPGAGEGGQRDRLDRGGRCPCVRDRPRQGFGGHVPARGEISGLWRQPARLVWPSRQAMRRGLAALRQHLGESLDDPEASVSPRRV
jgi:hypothetical protein